MEKVKISGKIFHACTIEGFERLYRMFDPDYETSFFTKCAGQIPLTREIVIEIEGEFDGIYSHQDMDAQRNYGYDEFVTRLSEIPECATVYLDDWLWDIWQDDYSGREDEDSEEAEAYDALYCMAEDFGIHYEKMPAIFEQACKIEEN